MDDIENINSLYNNNNNNNDNDDNNNNDNNNNNMMEGDPMCVFVSGILLFRAGI